MTTTTQNSTCPILANNGEELRQRAKRPRHDRSQSFRRTTSLQAARSNVPPTHVLKRGIVKWTASSDRTQRRCCHGTSGDGVHCTLKCPTLFWHQSQLHQSPVDSTSNSHNAPNGETMPRRHNCMVRRVGHRISPHARGRERAVEAITTASRRGWHPQASPSSVRSRDFSLARPSIPRGLVGQWHSELKAASGEDSCLIIKEGDSTTTTVQI
jgi:hypothetical protein